MLVTVERLLGESPLRVAISCSAGLAEVEWRGDGPIQVGEAIDVELDVEGELRWDGAGRLVSHGGACSLRAVVEVPARPDGVLVLRLGGEGLGMYRLVPGEASPSDGEELLIEEAALTAWPTGI